MKAKLSKKADKKLKSLDKDTRERVEKGIKKIPRGDIKPLVGYTDGRERLRIGKYRIIFFEENETIFVLDIGSRGDIYK